MEPPCMDTLYSQYVYENPTTSAVLGDDELTNDSMMYSVNASSFTLRYSKGVRVESNIQLF